MNLLKIDNKLIALHLKSTTIYNITDNLTGHTIRKIICSADRFVILTATKLYYLYYNKHKFTLVDVTDAVTSTVDISDIKFITNTSTRLYYHFGIITYSNKGFICKIKEFIIKSINHVFSLDNKNVVAVSNREFGYICDSGNGEYVVEYYNFLKRIETVGIVNKIPTYFISPDHILCGKQYMTHNTKTFVVRCGNISHMYNEDYYVSNNLIYCTIDLEEYWQKRNHGSNIIDGHAIVDYCCNHTIVLNNKTRIVNYSKNSENAEIHPIGKSYYCAENLPQYHNDVYNVKWTIGDHHLFGKYVDEYVKVVLWCHKYGSIRQWIPKGVLCLIIQFAL